jgi:hypothetical protein
MGNNQMKHPYTLKNLLDNRADIMEYDGIGWIVDELRHFEDSAQIKITDCRGKTEYHEFFQKDLNRAFHQIIEDRMNFKLNDRHFQEVIEETIFGWDWIIRYATNHGWA